MPIAKAKTEKAVSNKVQLFIIFWLGVLTGALAVGLILFFSGIKDSAKDSLLTPYTTTVTRYTALPTPPGQIVTEIPTPTGQ